jgi:hypothetical protein
MQWEYAVDKVTLRAMLISIVNIIIAINPTGRTNAAVTATYFSRPIIARSALKTPPSIFNRKHRLTPQRLTPGKNNARPGFG